MGWGDGFSYWRQEEKGTTEDEMVGWHHQLDGHEFEQAPGDGEGQRSLVCCLQSMGLQRLGHNWATSLLLFSFVTPETAAHQDSLSITNSWSLLKLMSIKLVLPSNHLILCHPLLLLASIFPTIKDIFDESVLCIWWPSTEASATAWSFQWILRTDFL